MPVSATAIERPGWKKSRTGRAPHRDQVAAALPRFAAPVTRHHHALATSPVLWGRHGMRQEIDVTFAGRRLLAAMVALGALASGVRAQTFTTMPLDLPPAPVAAPPVTAPLVPPTQPVPQPVPVAPAPLQGEAASPGSAATCGSLAALYLAPGNLKIWVTRRGTMVQDNPLRPLTNDRFVILQIVVNNRLASAYGPDYANLRRAGPPQTLEAAGGTRISWQDGTDALPPSLRVVTEDGSIVLDSIAFSACAEAPKVAAPAPAAKRPRKPAPEAGGAPARPGIALPQGAIP
jgi:hypothetical protein